MALLHAFVLLLTLLLCGWLVNADPNLHRNHPELHFRGLQANASSNTSLLAPYYRNVSAGAAWVVPKSAYDLGARDMSCECFNPDESCCMPKSSNLAPFCVPKNSICCSDTFCDAGETCCGDACCASETTCSFDHASSGCCPKGKICTGPATCYDHSSPKCADVFLHPPECCPPSIPYCRDFSPTGTGCFASAAAVITSVVSTIEISLDASHDTPTGSSSTAGSDSFQLTTRTTTTTTATTTTTTKTVTATVTLHPLLSDQPFKLASPSPPTTSPPPAGSLSNSTPLPPSTSALCFDAARQSAATCPTTHSASKPTFPSIPGETIYRSQAAPPPSPDGSLLCVLALVTLITTGILLIGCDGEHGVGAGGGPPLVRNSESRQGQGSPVKGQEEKVLMVKVLC